MVESRINVTFNKRKKLFKVVRLDLQTMTNQQLLYRRVSELKFSSQRIWSVNECLLSHGKEVSRLTEISLRNWDGWTGASGRMKKNYTSERGNYTQYTTVYSFCSREESEGSKFERAESLRIDRTASPRFPRYISPANLLHVVGALNSGNRFLEYFPPSRSKR